jgi:hypothetical protein
MLFRHGKSTAGVTVTKLAVVSEDRVREVFTSLGAALAFAGLSSE